jgi:hypothetical protein
MSLSLFTKRTIHSYIYHHIEDRLQREESKKQKEKNTDTKNVTDAEAETNEQKQ